jgi:hypothetical protein
MSRCQAKRENRADSGGMMFRHFGQWFQAAQDVLFALEFLIVQVFLIVHMVRTLFRFLGGRTWDR